MKEVVNDSLTYVARAKKLLDDYVEMNDIDNEALLYAAIDLLVKTEEVLVSAI